MCLEAFLRLGLFEKRYSIQFIRVRLSASVLRKWILQEEVNWGSHLTMLCYLLFPRLQDIGFFVRDSDIRETVAGSLWDPVAMNWVSLYNPSERYEKVSLRKPWGWFLWCNLVYGSTIFLRKQERDLIFCKNFYFFSMNVICILRRLFWIFILFWYTALNQNLRENITLYSILKEKIKRYRLTG